MHGEQSTSIEIYAYPYIDISLIVDVSDSVDSVTPTSSHAKEIPVPAQRRSLSKRESEEGFVAVERKNEATSMFSISTFDESKTDYKRIAKTGGAHLQ